MATAATPCTWALPWRCWAGVCGWGHAGALLVLPAFVLYMNRFQIVPEERMLAQKFGAPYTRYLQQVRRWL